MDIKGEKVKLTTSEARWIQEPGIFSKLPGLGNKVLEARIAFAAPHLPADQLPTIRNIAPTDGLARVLLESKLTDVRGVEASLGIDAVTKTERHIIEITMTPQEKQLLLELARIYWDLARQKAKNFSKYREQVGELQDIASVYFITSDAMSPQDALDFCGLARDPEFNEAMGEYEFMKALSIEAVTSGIIHALEADGQ